GCGALTWKPRKLSTRENRPTEAGRLRSRHKWWEQNSMDWSPVAPGVWKSVVGEAEKVTPLSLMEVQPAMAALGKLGERAFPFGEGEITGERAGGRVVV